MTTLGKTPRIFISYARTDGESFAKDLRRRLQEHGFSLWQDRTEMEGGKDWWQQIVEALDHVEYLLLVMTPAALKSPTVRREWRLARQKGVCVIPVMTSSHLTLDELPRWMRDAHFVSADVPEEWTRFLHTLESPCHTPRVPFMVEDLPADFVPRPGEFTALIDALLNSVGDEPVAITAALRGAGGYGKTTLARALCHDPSIQEAFHDGILWVTIGEQPGDLTPRVQDLIETLSGERPGFATLEAAIAHFVQLLGDLDLLIVIDDVWQAVHLRPFIQGGPRSARLITTRNSDVLPPNVTTLNVDAMRPDEATALLWTGLPSREHSAFHELARRLGEWPLLLKLVNGVLRKRVEQHGQSLAAALATVLQTLERRGVTAFDARNAVERDQAVTKTVQLSVSLLSEDERKRYSDLAIFPEDIDVPLSMVARLWDATGRLDQLATEDLCLRLSDLSLLLHLDLTRQSLRLHDVLRKYLQDQYDKESIASVHQTFLQTYDTARWDAIDPSETYLYTYLPYHLFHAGRKTELKSLLLDFDWLWAKLRTTDVTSVLGDYGWLPDDRSIQLVGCAIRLAAHVLAGDTHQFAGQLLGRLPASGTTDFDALLTKARAWKEKPWLRPLTPSLTPPGGRLISTLVGHSDRVTAVAITISGRIVSGSADRTVNIWDPRTGRMEGTLVGHTDWVTGVAVTPDGAMAVSASADRTMRVWDLAARKLQHILKGHEGPVTALAITPDGKRVVSGSGDQTLKLWDLATGKEERTLKGNTDGWNPTSVMAVTVTPDGHYAIAASEDGALKVWNLVQGQEERPFSSGHDVVKAAAVTPDCRYVVSASADSTLAVWDLPSRELQQTLLGHAGEVMAVAVTGDGRAISASRDGTLKLWEIATGRLKETLSGHTGLVTSVAVSPDGRSAASASWDRTLKVWDLTAEGKEHAPTGHSDVVTKITIPAGSTQCFSASADQTIKAWNIRTGQLDQTFFSPFETVHTLSVSPQSHRLVALGATSFGRETARTWNLATGMAEYQLAGRLHGARVEAMTKDGRWAATCQDHDELTIWDLDSGRVKQKLRRPLPGPFSTVFTPAISILDVTPDDRWAAAITKQESHPKTLTVWNFATGMVRTIVEYADGVNDIAMSHDGQMVVSGSHDHILRVYNLSLKEEHTLEGHAGPILRVTVTPDGQRVISASADHTLKVWNLARGLEERSLVGHTRDIVALSVTPDGERVISASSDRTLKLWNLSTGQVELTFVGHTDMPLSVAVMPDGRHAVSGSRGSVRLWDLTDGTEKGRIGNEVDAKTIAAAPDGRSLFLVNEKSELRVFNLETGVEDHDSTRPSPAIHFVAISSDGRWAVVHNENHLDVWDIVTGKTQCRLEQTEGASRHGYLTSADGLHFMSCGRPLRVWNVMTGKLKEGFECYGDWQTSAAHGGGRLVTGSRDGTLTVWDMDDCVARHTLRGHRTEITGIAVTADGNRAVSSSMDRSIRAWDLTSGLQLHVLDSRSHHFPKMAVSPNGAWVACSSREKTMDIFEMASGQRVCGISLDGPVSALGCGQAEERVIFAVGEKSGQVHLFTLEGLP